MTGGPVRFGMPNATLARCPDTANCVCSDCADPRHRVEPYRLNTADLQQAWSAAQAVVCELPRTIVVTLTGDYLHAECRSRLWRFVDDLELQLRPSQRVIAVRAASRSGYSDFGVNRRRVRRLRAGLRERGVIR